MRFLLYQGTQGGDRVIILVSWLTSFRVGRVRAFSVRFQAVGLVEVELFEVDIDDLAVQDLYHSVNSWS